MTKAQKHEAIEQMKSHCRLLMEQYKAGSGEYVMVSARELLLTLGFESAQVEEVLAEIARGGFSYCLDSSVQMSEKHDGAYPAQDVCVWGVDQLESRLDSLHFA